jgi:hypothetical protein
MVDDGNCQFRALSSECYGTQRWHKAIRARVVDHMAKHSSDFEIYFGDKKAFMEYLNSMKECGTWGDELTLRAACDLLNVKVYVITSEADNWLLHYDPDSSHNEPADKSLFITYVSPIHYNTIEHDTSVFTEAAAAVPKEKRKTVL